MAGNTNTTRAASGETRFILSGVCCASEEAVLRKCLDEHVGPDDYTFNPITQELRVAPSHSTTAVLASVRRAGFNGRQLQDLLAVKETFWAKHQLAFFTGVATLLALAGILLKELSILPLASDLLIVGAIGVGGWKVFVKAWKALASRALDMNVLMSIAVAGALAIGRTEEGAAVIILFAVSLMLESYSASRTRRAVQSLMSLSPDRACVIRDGKEQIVDAAEVVPGERFVVRPGERIPLDGIVREGTSSVNQAAITGEAAAISRKIGDTVYAGSINHNGSMVVEVTHAFENTTLARIIHLVEEAHQKRASVQRFVDRFAAVYTPAVLVLAVLIAMVPPLVFQESFGDWFYRALVLLVIACPCALVISTPVTIVSTLAGAARRGILIKGGKHLEALSRLNAIAFDKTGTLTEGRPRVTDVVPLNSYSRDELLRIAAALEHRSEHHLADALVREAEHNAIPHRDLVADSFEAIPGMGVRAKIHGSTFIAGNSDFCREAGCYSTAAESQVRALKHEGKTAIVVGKEAEAIGVIGLRDIPRKEAKEMLARLRMQGVGHIALLSGDHATVVTRLGAEIGVEHVYAGLLPGDKVSAVEQLKADHGWVAMVGDGINDAPALAASSVGIAMGTTGTDAALETADVVLMSDDLSRIPEAVSLAKRAMSIVRQNIAIALILKFVFLMLSVAGLATLWMAILADDGAALVVILNGLRAFSSGEKS